MIIVVKRPGNNVHYNLTYKSLSSKPWSLMVINILQQRHATNFRGAAFVADHVVTIWINLFPIDPQSIKNGEP